MRTQQPRPTGRASWIISKFCKERRNLDIRADNTELQNLLNAAFSQSNSMIGAMESELLALRAAAREMADWLGNGRPLASTKTIELLADLRAALGDQIPAQAPAEHCLDCKYSARQAEVEKRAVEGSQPFPAPTKQQMERALYAAHWYRCNCPWEEYWHPGPFEGKVIGTAEAYRLIGLVLENKEAELRRAGWQQIDGSVWWHHPSHFWGSMEIDAAYAKMSGDVA